MRENISAQVMTNTPSHHKGDANRQGPGTPYIDSIGFLNIGGLNKPGKQEEMNPFLHKSKKWLVWSSRNKS